MKIRVIESVTDEGTTHVTFQSPAGNATALWRGTAPRVDEVLDVELHLDDVFFWGKNIKTSIKETASIVVENGVTQITAELIPGEDKECAALKICDSIVLIELDGALVQESGFVELTTDRIQLYPTNI